MIAQTKISSAISNHEPQTAEVRKKPQRYRNIVTDGSRTITVAEYSGALLSQKGSQQVSA